MDFNLTTVCYALSLTRQLSPPLTPWLALVLQRLRHLSIDSRRGAFRDALGATTGLGNDRYGLFRHHALLTRFARLLREPDKDTSSTVALQDTVARARRGADTVAAATLVQGKSTSGVATGRPRFRFSRCRLKEGTAELSASYAVPQGTGWLGRIDISAIIRQVDKTVFVEGATWAGTTLAGALAT